MYRKRGEPVEAPAGEYLGCALTHQLIRKAKWWFGLYYSQEAWDQLLTEDANGYPLTAIEFTILGLTKVEGNQSHFDRSYVEQHSGTIPQFAFMIINDLKQFGLLEGEHKNELMITAEGRRALNGLSRRIYGRAFSAKMIEQRQLSPSDSETTERTVNSEKKETEKPAQQASKDAHQASLF
jgi:hypothetical protein